MAREPRSARYASKLGKPLPVFCCHSLSAMFGASNIECKVECI